MKRILVKSFVLALCICLTASGLIFVGEPMSAATTSNEVLSAAYRAYYDVLTAAVEEHGAGSHMSIPDGRSVFGGVVYAKLVDFDNDGIPELIYIYGTYDTDEDEPSMAMWTSTRNLVIYGFSGRAERIFSSSSGYDGLTGEHSRSWYVATSRDGNNYFVIHDSSDYGSNTDYMRLTNRNWTTVLNLSGRFNFEAEMAGELDVFFVYVNGNRVSRQEYERAPERELGIDDRQGFEFWRDGMTFPTVSAVRAELRGGIAPPTPTISVLLDGTPMLFDVSPQIINGRTMVPLRAIFEALGAEVEWDGAAQMATATRGDTVVVLPIGSTSPRVNGQVVTIDQPGVIVGGRTLVPLRFVAESFGVGVNWDGATRTVTITS